MTWYGPQYLGLVFLFNSFSMAELQIRTKSLGEWDPLIRRVSNQFSNCHLDLIRVCVSISIALAMSLGWRSNCRMHSASNVDVLSFRLNPSTRNVDSVTVFPFFRPSLVTFTTLTFPSTAQPVHLFLSRLYSFALFFTATRIASLFLSHHSNVFFPSSYAVPLGLCTFSRSINISSLLV